MNEERLKCELEELERWFRSFPPPKLSPESVRALKLRIAGALSGAEAKLREIPRPTEALKEQLKAAVRRELAAAEHAPGLRMSFSMKRVGPWLASAAALVFLIVGYGLLHKSPQQISEQEPIELTWPFPPELASIEVELASLEVQSLAADFIYFGRDDIDREVLRDIERLLEPGLYGDPADEPD